MEHILSHLHVNKSKGSLAQSGKILLLELVSAGVSECLGLILQREGRCGALVQHCLFPTHAAQHLASARSHSDLSPFCIFF